MFNTQKSLGFSPPFPFLPTFIGETILFSVSCAFYLVSVDVYNIVSDRGSVGRFCLFKSAYRIGEEIVGSFDFSDSLIICLKVNIFLFDVVY